MVVQQISSAEVVTNNNIFLSIICKLKDGNYYLIGIDNFL